jgi:hypothetical protein
MDNLKLRIEQFFPIVVALLSGIVILFSHLNLQSVPKLETILNSAITVSSIMIGFLATMISILISISNRKIMKRIRDGKAEGLLNWYIREAIISGFFMAIYSTGLYLFLSYDGTYSKFLLAVWVLSIIHFVLASYRIMHVLLNILAALPKEYSNESKESNVYTPSTERAFAGKKRKEINE